MKHLAVIQFEFLKAAFTKEAASWDELSHDAQKEYLKKHRKSKRKMTAKPGQPGKDLSNLKESIGEKREKLAPQQTASNAPDWIQSNPIVGERIKKLDIDDNQAKIQNIPKEVRDFVGDKSFVDFQVRHGNYGQGKDHIFLVPNKHENLYKPKDVQNAESLFKQLQQVEFKPFEIADTNIYRYNYTSQSILPDKDWKSSVQKGELPDGTEILKIDERSDQEQFKGNGEARYIILHPAIKDVKKQYHVNKAQQKLQRKLDNKTNTLDNFKKNYPALPDKLTKNLFNIDRASDPEEKDGNIDWAEGGELQFSAGSEDNSFSMNFSTPTEMEDQLNKFADFVSKNGKKVEGEETGNGVGFTVKSEDGKEHGFDVNFDDVQSPDYYRQLAKFMGQHSGLNLEAYQD
jgi:hypothetical protein